MHWIVLGVFYIILIGCITNNTYMSSKQNAKDQKYEKVDNDK